MSKKQPSELLTYVMYYWESEGIYQARIFKSPSLENNITHSFEGIIQHPWKYRGVDVTYTDFSRIFNTSLCLGRW